MESRMRFYGIFIFLKRTLKFLNYMQLKFAFAFECNLHTLHNFNFENASNQGIS